MKRIVLVLAAAAALLCGCDKYASRIENIEGRLTALEQRCDDLNNNYIGIGKIVDALNNNISIKEVKKVENGFQIIFSDETSYYITNGPKGDTPDITAAEADGTYYWKVNGEWLTDGAGNKIPVTGATPQLKYDGETNTWYVSTDGGQTWEKVGVQKTGTDITFSEDDEAYYFDFGDGNVAKISKMASFVMKVENDNVSVEAGKAVTVAYAITGGDETTHVVAEASGYTAKVDEAAASVTITAGASVEPGYVILKAIRNSDGASSSQFIAVNNGEQPQTQEKIALTITEVTYNAVSYTAVPENDKLNYIINLMPKDAIEEYGLTEDDALFQDDMDYFEYLGQLYDYSLDEILELIASQGTVSETIDELDPETDYVLYAYAFTADKTLDGKITRVEFTTPEAPTGAAGYEAVLGQWLYKGTITSNGETKDYEGTITFAEKVKNESFTVTGFYNTYPLVANYEADRNIISIPFGADNPIAKFNFGSIGIKWGCWMGYDGTYVYTGGSFYWKLNDSCTEMTSATMDSDTGEPLDPIGITCGVFDINEDDSVGAWSRYTFGDGSKLFTSITKINSGSSSAASVKTAPKKRISAEKAITIKNEKAEPANMLSVR